VPRLCESCRHPEATEINRKIRAGTTFEDISRWLAAEHDTKLTAVSIGQHAKKHIGHVNPRGRRPKNPDLLAAIVEDVSDQLARGEVRPSIKEGIAAQRAIDARASKSADRDLMLRIAIALTGAGSVPALPDPSVTIIEGEFRHLLETGD
jgi:hypothetical protein